MLRPRRAAQLEEYGLDGGWFDRATKVPSPNFGPRPEGVSPELLVIHNISLPPGCYGGNAIERFFTNRLDFDEHPFYAEIRGMQVSAHLLIRRDGELLQFVDLQDRAWHAGLSSFRGRENCNDFSIGIELEGTDNDPYTDAQYEALSAVTIALQKNYPDLRRDRIVGHCHIAPGRKTDPGGAFDWLRFRGDLAAMGENS